jgi:crotonobetainyl-CoA:carnitine CoA-transferase CaiB-like acyl-CoA transferase
MRTPLSFSRDAVTPYRAPALGEHTREIALGLAGLSVERLAELECGGVLK